MSLLALAVVAAFLQVSDSPIIVVDRDNVEIRRSCRVQIHKDVLVDEDGNGVVQIVADGVTVDFDGQALRGAALDATPDTFSGFGIRITGKNVTLRNATVSGFKGAIWATRADGLTVEDCDVSHNFRQRLRSTPQAEDLGDWLWPHRNDDNEWLKNYGAGIYVEESEGITIRRNVAHQSQNGLCLRRVNRSQVYDNDFSFLSGWGIAMFRCCGNVAARNNCDFCVRGYSHGVYSRGQDSAGILFFEQCHDNLFAYNSATHSGDGFFGYAGHEALEGDVREERVGNNRNILYRNDFSFAPAIGIEMTFSFDNQYVENILNGSNYGIWGGYSSFTHVERNTIEDNLIAGIAVEHGSQWMVLRNALRNNARGVQFWWDEDKDLLAKPWAKLNPTWSRDHQIAGNRIHVGEGQVGIELTGGTDGVRVYDNQWSGAETRYRVDDKSHYQELDQDAQRQSFNPEQLPPIPGERQALGFRKHLAGRDRIIITEWGPYDWQSPYLHFVGAGPKGDEYRLLGDSPAGTPSISGAARVEAHAETTPPMFTVVPDKPGVVTAYELTIPAGAMSLSAKGVLTVSDWSIRVFAYKTDPRQDAERWRQESTGAVAFNLPYLELPYGNGGPSQLKAAPDALRNAKLPADHFGTLAETTLTFPAGKWKLSVTSDDGVRTWLDDRLVIDNWTHHAPTTDTAELSFDAQTTARIRVEHFELDGYAVLTLRLEAN